jgi:hypothetical protein
MKAAGLIVIAAILAGCCGMPVAECPALTLYDGAFNAQLADEVDILPETSALLRAVRDYISLRDQVRACRDTE